MIIMGNKAIDVFHVTNQSNINTDVFAYHSYMVINKGGNYTFPGQNIEVVDAELPRYTTDKFRMYLEFYPLYWSTTSGNCIFNLNKKSSSNYISLDIGTDGKPSLSYKNTSLGTYTATCDVAVVPNSKFIFEFSSDGETNMEVKYTIEGTTYTIEKPLINFAMGASDRLYLGKNSNYNDIAAPGIYHKFEYEKNNEMLFTLNNL